MPPLRITPWQRAEEVLEVRSLFFSRHGHGGELSANAEDLALACDIVDAWTVRGRVPHAIRATGALARAFLGDGGGSGAGVGAGVGNHPALVASGYAVALSNFVTGLVDSGQDAGHKRSMFEVARSIGLPEAYVRLRHDIVHEGFSNIIELRRFGAGALKWLYEEYWRHLKSPEELRRAVVVVQDAAAEGWEEGSTPQNPSKDFEAQMQSLLGDYRNNMSPSGATATGYIPQRRAIDRHASKVGKKINAVISNQAELNVLVDAIIHYTKVPEKCNGTQVIYETFDQLEPLLLVLHRLQRNFLPSLAKKLVAVLCSPSGVSEEMADQSYMCTLWLHLLCTSDSWRSARRSGQLIPGDIVLSCVANPGLWSTQLALMLSEADCCKGHKGLDEALAPLREMMAEVKDQEEGQKSGSDLVMEDVGRTDSSGLPKSIDGDSEVASTAVEPFSVFVPRSIGL